MYFDRVKMVHNGIGYEFQTRMEPAGGTVSRNGKVEVCRNFIGVYNHQYQKGLYEKLEGILFIEFVDGFKLPQRYKPSLKHPQRTWGKSDFEANRMAVGRRNFLRIGGENPMNKLREKGFVKEKIGDPGKFCINVVVLFGIPEDYFAWEKIVEKKETAIPADDMNVPLQLLRDVVVEEETSGSDRPPQDTVNVLDFKIHTIDGFIIRCQKYPRQCPAWCAAAVDPLLLRRRNLRL